MHPPDLFVDGIQVLLKYHRQSVGIGLPTGQQLNGRAEQGDPVALAARHILITLEGPDHGGHHAGLLRGLPVLLPLALHLGTRGPRLVIDIQDSSRLSGTEHNFTLKPQLWINGHAYETLPSLQRAVLKKRAGGESTSYMVW